MQGSTLKEEYQTSFYNQDEDYHQTAPNQPFVSARTIQRILDGIPPSPSLMDQPQQTKKITRICHSKKWSRVQTANFYQLLARTGPNFSEMQISVYFDGRRGKKQLKTKYNKEIKVNESSIDKSLDIFYSKSLRHID